MYFSQNAGTRVSPPPRLDIKDKVPNIEIPDH